MKLLDRCGYRADDFARDDAPASAGPTIVPLTELPAAIELGDGRRLGVEIPNTTAVEDTAPYFGALSLIAVVFPAYADGRGFSLARRLRRAGYKGRLRAVGPLISDQLPHALACGFDELELPDANAARQPDRQWRAAPHAVTIGYQDGYARSSSIFNERRRALQENRNG